MKETEKNEFDSSSPSFIAAIGVSSGGIVALKSFFSSLKEVNRISFIIIQHLDSEGKEITSTLLQEFTRLPIVEINNGIFFEAGKIYLASPHSIVNIRDEKLISRPVHDKPEKHAVIDTTFRNLAETLGHKLVGIVLSGDGSDASQGIKAIHDEGGMVIVQSPESTEYPSMSQTAISSGIVDYVLRPEGIPTELTSYEKYVARMFDKSSVAALRDQIGAALIGICEILHKATKHDFKHYKTSTLIRRIQRRMQVLQLNSIESYVERLTNHGEEVEALFKELLINVTSFFRDSEAFDEINSEVIKKKFANRGADQKFRMWVAGCSTGEEVYSFAMLIKEQLELMKNPPEVQIIATDIDEHALNLARKGAYSVAIEECVSKERLAKYFIRRAGKYHVSKELRELCLFSSHNLINDPPFSQLDLISCRNVLIYLGTHLQKKLIPVFHYALKPDGYLFLGTSETLSSHKELFSIVSAKNRIAQRKSTAIRPQANFSTTLSSVYAPHFKDAAQSHETDLHLVSQRIVLDEFSPKYAVVNEENQIVSVSSGLTEYLEPSEGSFQNSIVKLVKPALRMALRSTLSEAIKHKRQIHHESSTLKTENTLHKIGITVQPMPKLGEESGLYMVIFHKLGKIQQEDGVADPDPQVSTINAEFVDQLERELLATRQDLDKTVQDLEASNEELKSSNEELLSMNEELQSANEELETSKEEVQSSNEALQRTNSDLENLLASTQIATLFLDRHLRIKSFTPAITEIYRIQASDIGREIGDFVSRAMGMPKFPNPETVTNFDVPLETEIMLPNGQVYLRRILPYRTHEEKREGIVVTFVDVTELRRSEGRFQVFATALPVIAWTGNPEGDAEFFNAKWYEYTGQTKSQALGWHWKNAIHTDDVKKAINAWKRCLKTGENYHEEFRIRRHDGVYRWFETNGTCFRDGDESILQWFGTCVDIEEQKNEVNLLRESAERLRRAHLQLSDNEKRLEMMIKTSPSFMCMLTGKDYLYEQANEQYMRLVGHDDIVGKPVLEAVPELRGQGFIELLDQVRRTGKPFIGTEVPAMLKRDSGMIEKRYLDFVYQPDTADMGNLARIFVHGVDVTEKMLIRQSIENERANFRNLFKQTPEMVCILTGPDHVFEFVNEAHVKVLGFDATGKSVRVAQPESVEVHGILDDVYHTGKTAELNEIPITLGGRLRYFNLTYAARRNNDNQINGVMILGTEITEQILNRKVLQSAKAAAENASNAKSTFLANMSHEIRTPLGAIMGFSDLLVGTVLENSTASNYLSRIKRNSTQLGRLIDELLDLSKIEANRLEVERTSVDLNSAIEDAFSAVSLQAKEKGLEFSVKRLNEIPEKVLTDPTRFRQILINLVGNAIKFTEKGKVIVEFRSVKAGLNTSLEVRVTDSGIGLSLEQQQNLFQAFSQADPSITRKYGGTGLGLVLSRELARLLGGDIHLEQSKVGFGSVFVFTTDLGSDIEITEANQQIQHKTPATVSNFKNCRVLIVDDSPDNQELVGLYLEQTGANYELASDGEEALEKIKAGDSFDLVLMDLQMPKMDGYTALAALRKASYKVPVIALTAHALKSEREKCFDAGFNDYVTKPIHFQSLLEAMKRLMTSR